MGLIITMLVAFHTRAEPSCLPGFNALQVIETIASTTPTQRLYPLQTEGGQGRFATKARLALKSVGRAVDLEALFDPEFDGVSLAYNLYAIQVVRDGEVVLWTDFSQDCAGLPISFYPGRRVRLPSVHLPDDKPHRLQILVWGRL